MTWHTDKDSIMSKTDNKPALPTIAIDGAFGEGGGQIIRTSVSLAAITGRAVEIVNIRARRSKPGLQAQHLTSVRAAGALCDATLYGAELGSQFLRFLPNALVASDSFRFDVAEARGGASAGATGLVAQTLLVPLAFLPAFTGGAAAGAGNPGAGNAVAGGAGGTAAGVGSAVHGAGSASGEIRVTILGGTHVPMSPTADYLEGAYRPILRRLGLDAEMRSVRAGFFPRGGGEIALHLRGGGLNTPLDLTERGRLQTLRAFVTTSQLPDHVADRAEDVLRKELKGYGVPVQVEKRSLDSNGAGAAVVLIAECQNGRGGWVSLGERGKPMEKVTSDAIRGFRDWQAGSAATDEHLADQLVLPCALIPGESRWTTPLVTDHLRTVLFVAQQFLPIEYELQEQEDGSGLVILRGCDVNKIHCQ